MSTITCRAAVLWAPNDLRVETVQVPAPKGREVRVKILYNSLCHTDLFFIEGKISAKYPIILGHEATGIVESVGEEVTWFQPGDHVIPVFMPRCQECRKCKRGDTNFCEKLNIEDFSNPYTDGQTRLTCRGKEVCLFMGTSSFSEYTIIMDRHLAKISPTAPLNKACLLGCGFTTGYGSAVKTAKVKKGDRVAVFGAGAVGLSAIHGAFEAGASEVFAIDLNPHKEKIAKKMGATVFVNPAECPKDVNFDAWFVEKYGHLDQTLECIGNLQCMRSAVHITEPGWGRTVIVGLGPAGKDFCISPYQFLERKTVLGSYYGVPELALKLEKGDINVDPLITHKFELEDVHKAIELLKQAETIRSVITLAKE